MVRHAQDASGEKLVHSTGQPGRIGPQARPALLRMRRRDFLTLGSLLALAPWAERFAFASPLAPDAPDADAATFQPPVAPEEASVLRQAASIGYLEGSDTLRDLRRFPAGTHLATVLRRGNTLTEQSRIVPAASLPAGEAAFADGAVRLTVHGLYPTIPARRDMPRAVDLDIYSPLAGAGSIRAALVEAWSYRRLPAESHSSRFSLLIWPDFSHDLVLSVRVVPARAGEPATRFDATFTLGSDTDRPRLARGIYLLGLTADAWEEPADLPADLSALVPRQLSILLTAEPEGVRVR